MRKLVLGALILFLVSSCSDGTEEIDLAPPFRDCPTCPLMQAIPAGSFTMGAPRDQSLILLQASDFYLNEQPQHRVTIDRPFAIGVHEITVGQFRKFIEATNRLSHSTCAGLEEDSITADEKYSWDSPGYAQEETYPAVCVSWEEAVDFTVWLSEETGTTYRLPSESEWEYATRAGASTRFFWGNRIPDACRFANIADETAMGHFKWQSGLLNRFHCSDNYPIVAPTARRDVMPNDFRLFDTIGNVAEWVQDCYFDSHADAPIDGSARDETGCDSRVVKGSEWGAEPVGSRPAFRTRSRQDDGDAVTGFRIVREM